jgi:hypothetical protein
MSDRPPLIGAERGASDFQLTVRELDTALGQYSRRQRGRLLRPATPISPLMKIPRRALATDFGVWPAFRKLHQLSDAMLASPAHWSSLANYLILYDQIVIPTSNLQVLPVLRHMLGDAVFEELVRTKVIVFARYDQWFGFAGGGAGLSFFQILPGERADRGMNIGMAHFLPLERAIDVALDYTTPIVEASQKRSLAKLLGDHVVELPMPTGDLDRITEETIKDVIESPYLREALSLKNKHPNKLGNLPSTKLAIFNPHVPPEPGENREIRSVLRVAFENFLLHVGGLTDATDITGDDATLTVLRAKGQRYGAPIEGSRAFAQIQKISGIPDIGSAFANKLLTSEKLLALRDSTHAASFREWFAEGSPSENADATVRRFVEQLQQPSWIDRSPAKSLRFAITTAWGSLEPISGTLIGIADNFLLSRWWPTRSPRLFLKQAKVALARPPLIGSESKGRDRNADCYCGSGKKYKRCHGKA